jgi:hypothetical protein
MHKPNARLTMRLTRVTSNVEPERYMSLVIEDVISGRQVAAFELLGEHLLDLLGGRQVGGVDGMDAWLVEPRDRPALGKLTFTTEHRFELGKYCDDTVARWARRTAPALGAHEYSVKKNNAAMNVVRFVFYVYPDEQERLAEIAAARQATMDVAAMSCAADR